MNRRIRKKHDKYKPNKLTYSERRKRDRRFHMELIEYKHRICNPRRKLDLLLWTVDGVVGIDRFGRFTKITK